MKFISLTLVAAAILFCQPGLAAEYSTRVIENGTPVVLKIGDQQIPATLNDSKSSQALLARLPFAMRLHKYAHDYCGVMADPLPYDEADVHKGWLNGDIDFARDGNYFTILYEDQEKSGQYGHQITLGKVEGPLEVIKSMGPDIEITVDLPDKAGK